MKKLIKKIKDSKLVKNKVFRITVFCTLLLIWAFAAFVLSQFATAYPLLWIFGKEWLNSSVGMLVYTIISYVLAAVLVLLVPALISKKFKTSREELGLTGLPTWTDIGLAPIAYIAATIGALGLVSLFSLFPWFNATETQDVGAKILAGGWDRAMAFVRLVVIAPIVEELVFRGWLYGKLRTKLAMPIAIALVSILFGIVHWQWNVGVNVFAMSIVLCGLREITGTIYAGILMHMVKNAIALAILIFFPGMV